jgi:hypothetical protein
VVGTQRIGRCTSYKCGVDGCVNMGRPPATCNGIRYYGLGGGGATNRLDRRSYECANASSCASLPGSPTNEILPAGIPSAPKPVGTETSGSPSQFP